MTSGPSMKRVHDSVCSSDYEEKKSRLHFEKLRFLVLGQYASALVGSEGVDLKRVMDKYRVKISGLSVKATERVLQVTGPRPNAFNALSELFPICPEAMYPAWDASSRFTINLLVNSSIAGNIIGKKGWRYNDICQKTGIHLKVYPECLPSSTERVVSIAGDHLGVVMHGLETILNVLDSADDNQSCEVIFFRPSEDRSLPGPMDIRLRRKPFRGNQVLGTSGISLDSIAGLLVDKRDAKLGGDTDISRDFGFVKTTTALTVPNGLVGVIIGSGGDNITYIKRVSGAFITFSKPESAGDPNRTVTLTGSQYQVQIAEQLMSQCIRMNNEQKRKKSRGRYPR